tara:strand:+ start:161 stop:820 length:660 start_codon:yes stop_codon:yes gene_type:complete
MKYIKKLNESTVNEKVKSWNDVAKVVDKALKKANVPLSYAKDYVKSLERMAKRDAKQFFADYGDFAEGDFIEDVEYNMANESAVNENYKTKAGFVAIYKVMGQEFKFGPLKTDDKKSIMAMLSKAIQGGFQLVRVVPADQVKESTIPGDEDYPETLDIDEAAPRMKKNEDAIYLQDLMNKVANAKKGGSGSRYGKEFDKSKTKALRAIKDMVMYSTIGI